MFLLGVYEQRNVRWFYQMWINNSVYVDASPCSCIARVRDLVLPLSCTPTAHVLLCTMCSTTVRIYVTAVYDSCFHAIALESTSSERISTAADVLVIAAAFQKVFAMHEECGWYSLYCIRTAHRWLSNVVKRHTMYKSGAIFVINCIPTEMYQVWRWSRFCDPMKKNNIWDVTPRIRGSLFGELFWSLR